MEGRAFLVVKWTDQQAKLKLSLLLLLGSPEDILPQVELLTVAAEDLVAVEAVRADADDTHVGPGVVWQVGEVQDRFLHLGDQAVTMNGQSG